MSPQAVREIRVRWPHSRYRWAEAHRLSWTPRSPASLHANVKSKAVSSPGRSFACTPAGDA